MIDLAYSLVIEATAKPNFFTFFSPDLRGFTGVGNSIEDCVWRAKSGMEDHVQLLKTAHLPIPRPRKNPRITIQNAQLRRAG